MIRLVISAVVALWLAGPARAASIDGVSLPDTYRVGAQTLVLNGIGIRTVTILRVRAYVAGLYLPQKSRDAAAIMASPGPKVVLLQFLHSASKQQVEHQYREGENNNCGHGECAQSDAADFERLVAATPGAEVGDTLTYVVTASGLRAFAGSRELGTFNNPDLGLRILAGFIGAKPPSEDLKQHLLGLTE